MTAAAGVRATVLAKLEFFNPLGRDGGRPLLCQPAVPLSRDPICDVHAARILVRNVSTCSRSSAERWATASGNLAGGSTYNTRKLFYCIPIAVMQTK